MSGGECLLKYLLDFPYVTWCMHFNFRLQYPLLFLSTTILKNLFNTLAFFFPVRPPKGIH